MSVVCEGRVWINNFRHLLGFEGLPCDLLDYRVEIAKSEVRCVLRYELSVLDQLDCCLSHILHLHRSHHGARRSKCCNGSSETWVGGEKRWQDRGREIRTLITGLGGCDEPRAGC